MSPTELEEPTSYELECKASVAAWEEVQHSMLHMVTESGYAEWSKVPFV